MIAVDVGVGQRRLDRSGIVGRRRAPVERHGPVDGDEPGRLERGACQRPGAAGVGDDGHVRAFQHRLGRHHPDGLEERGHRGHLDQAGLLVQRSTHLAGRRGSRPDRDHRLGSRHPSRDPGELARVAERLGVHGDHGRVVVLLPELQQVVAGDVALVAQRDEPRHPEVHVAGLAEERPAERTRLHGDGHAAGRQGDVDERRLEPGLGAGRRDAHARRPDDPQSVATSAGDQRRHVDVGAVDGRDDDRTAHALGDAGVDVASRSLAGTEMIARETSSGS